MMTTPKIEEFVFPQADFPREFDIQLWAFVRLVWGEVISGDDRFRTRSWDEPTPTHFVRAAGDLLVSHVLVFPLSIEGHRGALRVGCVGAVLTFPQTAAIWSRRSYTLLRNGRLHRGFRVAVGRHDVRRARLSAAAAFASTFDPPRRRAVPGRISNALHHLS